MSVFSLDLFTPDKRRDGLPIWTQRRLSVPRGEHKLDVLDRFSRNLRIRPGVDNPEADPCPGRGFPADGHGQRKFYRSQLKTQPLALGFTHRFIEFCAQLLHHRCQLQASHTRHPHLALCLTMPRPAMTMIETLLWTRIAVAALPCSITSMRLAPLTRGNDRGVDYDEETKQGSPAWTSRPVAQTGTFNPKLGNRRIWKQAVARPQRNNKASAKLPQRIFTQLRGHVADEIAISLKTALSGGGHSGSGMIAYTPPLPIRPQTQA